MLQIMKYLTRKRNILIPMLLQHSKASTVCDTKRPKAHSASKGAKDKGVGYGAVCPGRTSGGGSKDDAGGTVLKRALRSGKCRLGFIPEEWFLFFSPMTGVSGPYIFMIGLGNYLVSKEIFIMEHEYYIGLSIFTVAYLITTRFGPAIGVALDKEVDAITNEMEQGRQAELTAITTQIKSAEATIWRAEGQKELIDAKKENVAIQLEAEYRERQMTVYRGVQRKMEYHLKRHWASRRLKHKCMVEWILRNVHKGITPEFKKNVMEIAIKDLTALADKYEASQAKK